MPLEPNGPHLHSLVLHKAVFRMARTYRKYFRGKPDEDAYRALFRLHLSRFGAVRQRSGFGSGSGS